MLLVSTETRLLTFVVRQCIHVRSESAREQIIVLYKSYKLIIRRSNLVQHDEKDDLWSDGFNGSVS